LVTPLVVFYSQGYRFDFESRKITQTGAFSIKAWPNGSLIYLNDKLVKKTHFLFGTAFIDGLLPKKYKIEVKKDGYYPWQKNLDIKKEIATEMKNIFLVPENIKFEILIGKIEDFFVSPDGKKSILKKASGKNWSLYILDLEKNNQSLLLLDKDIIKEGQEIKSFRLKWSDDSKKVLIEFNDKENRYFVIELDKDKKTISLDFIKGDIAGASFNPDNSQRIFFIRKEAEKNSLFLVDYNKKEVTGPILDDILAYQLYNGNLFWLNKEGFIVQSDLSGGNIINLNLQPLSLKEGAKYKIIVSPGEKVFLKENDNLYFLNTGNQSFEKILSSVKDIVISPDMKKVAYFTDSEIWIFFLKKIEEQPQKEENEKSFLTRFSGKIDNLFWWTSHYLIFNSGEQIKIIEIDDRDKINIYTLADFKNPKIFWNEIDKKLYVLSNGNLYSSEKLIK
jgi:predicted DNA-binding antitoxin AbrB/MazE fold protein